MAFPKPTPAFVSNIRAWRTPRSSLPYAWKFRNTPCRIRYLSIPVLLRPSRADPGLRNNISGKETRFPPCEGKLQPHGTLPRRYRRTGSRGTLSGLAVPQFWSQSMPTRLSEPSGHSSSPEVSTRAWLTRTTPTRGFRPNSQPPPQTRVVRFPVILDTPFRASRASNSRSAIKRCNSPFAHPADSLC